MSEEQRCNLMTLLKQLLYGEAILFGIFLGVLI